MVLAVAALAGCAGPGQLHDAGPTRPLASPPSPPSPVELWPAVALSTSPTPAVGSPGAPEPVPGITVSGDDIRTVDVSRLLRQDSRDVPASEQEAVTGCTGCQVLAPQFRDLTGDGREELLTAVLTADQRGDLHVYRLVEHQLVPILTLPVAAGFWADTLLSDLEVHEPAGTAAVVLSTYHWDGARLAFSNRQIKPTGPGGDAPACLLGDLQVGTLPASAKPTLPRNPGTPSAGPIQPSARPSVAPPAPGGAGAAPAFATPSALPSAAPPAAPVPSAPPATPGVSR
ncbi:lipoprotein [Kitasatospora nipponensis]|uniref:Lipoprotein n=1 Tax=Kitasatospora nipponensis TaxID=258049 RepID=A0ABN1X0A6_9ACTN